MTRQQMKGAARGAVAAATIVVALLAGAHVVSAVQRDGARPSRVGVVDPEKRQLLEAQDAFRAAAENLTPTQAAAASTGKLPVPIVGTADDPWPLGIFEDPEAPFPLMEFTPVTRWVGVNGTQYVVLYTGEDTQNPANGAARLQYYNIVDGLLVSASTPALPPGEGTLTISSATSTEVLMRSANGALHTFNVLDGTFS